MLVLRDVSKRLGAFQLEHFDLSLNGGEFFVLLGPSGVGKTVLLELVTGIQSPDAGRISWGDQDLTRVPPERRDFALVYQDYALFPHLSVRANVGYGLRARGVSRSEIQRRVSELAELVGFPELLERTPSTLSGGEQQRVALARALAIRPRLLLLDEPLAALDPPTRVRLRRELQRIHAETGVTCLQVTHDADEAMQLGQRIGVMLDRRLHQTGSPEELFRAPSDRAVAEFLGLRNVFSVKYVRPGVCEAHGCEVHAAEMTPDHSCAWIKPEEIVLSNGAFPSSARNQIVCSVTSMDPSGVLWAIHLRSGELPLTALLTRASVDDLQLESGKRCYATFKSSSVHCF